MAMATASRRQLSASAPPDGGAPFGCQGAGSPGCGPAASVDTAPRGGGAPFSRVLLPACRR
eukprot:11214417-Lingulodinium_polyedra.AAC.1